MAARTRPVVTKQAVPLRLLLIEDSENDAVLLLRELRRAGYAPEHERVQSAETMQAALDRQTWDLVIADFTMPDFSGTSALTLLRQRGLDTPFIFVSGTITEDTAVAAMRAGAQDYVLKGNLKRLGPAVDRELRDARERKRAQEAQRTAAEMVRAVVDASPLAIIGLDPEDRVTLWNRAAEHTFGWSELDVLGNVNPVIPEEGRAAVSAFRERAFRGEAVTGVEIRGLRRDGSPIDLKASFAATRLSGGTASGVMAVFEDITQSRKLEEQLHQAQKMEAIGRLAGAVAHDFNNILTIVLADAQMLLMSLPGDSPLQESAKEIKDAANRATALTRQLLAFSRRQVLEPKVCDLNQVVGDLEQMIRRLIGERIETTVQLDPMLGLVKADPGRLEQVLFNLAVNARDAMPEGGTLILETANATLDEEYARAHAEVTPGDYVLCSVSDTGTGMTPEAQAHLFEPFFTTKERGKGTGIGLATCYGIVKQFGGHIGVYSEVGVGTTMRVYLPRTAGTGVAPVPAAGPPPRGTETILLVEDNQQVRGVARQGLTALGYAVLVAADGPEALELLSAHPSPVHLLLTDIFLPGMSGREVAERARAGRRDIKILFASGYSDDVILQRELLKHNAQLIQKPFTQEALARKVRHVLDTTLGA